jgi:23S rRNA (guanosine2251-2'-O)-methyltransferase
VIVYGRNPVREALRGRRAVTRIWATKNTVREEWLSRSSVPVTPAAADEIDRRAGSDAHQGVCAEVEPFRYVEAAQLYAPDRASRGTGAVGRRGVGADPLIVALDQVQDPQNFGAICRTAECVGAAGVVIPERRSAEVTPAVCKASAGAVEHLAIARVRNLADFLAEVKAAGGWCYGADRHGALGYDTVDWGGPVVLVLGSEGRGLRPRIAAACDALVALPVRGRIDSLSVSAAAAVLMYAAMQGRGGAPTA